jgi:heat shock protein HslJ
MKSIKILLMVLLLSSIFSLTACGSDGATLEDTTWVLESYGEKGNLEAVLEDTEIAAFFDSAKGQVAGSAGCNRYFVGYEINKNKLTLKPPLGSTMMACPKPVMDQEQQYFSILETAETFQIQNSRFTISSSGNQILIFAAQ